jgi:hypothetical protein
VEAPVKTAPKPVTPAMAAPGESEAPVLPPKDTPIWKSPAFWIGTVGGPVLGVILAILLAFGVIQKKHLKYLRDNDIVKTADKVVNGFETFAAGTKITWDDVIAQALRAVVNRVGDLTEEEKQKVKNVVEDRKNQAEAKEKAVAADETEAMEDETKPETEKDA